jgi:hypothetical protein
MKWLQDNPLGMALAAVGGVLVLFALGMTIVWTLPVSLETIEADVQESGTADSVLVARETGDISDFEVINERPLFNMSRKPVVTDSEAEGDSLDLSVQVKDAPDVRLTGVIITPGMKIASLTPTDGNLKTVMAHEGEPLTGEFVGWQVSSVSPREVVLESRDGQTLNLELQVHDATIKEPPKPVAPVTPATDQDKELAGEDGEPLSRAEQIRQRIAERREELRLEQEEQRSLEDDRDAGGNQPANTKPPDYQSAIRSMMRNNSKDQSSDDKKDR